MNIITDLKDYSDNQVAYHDTLPKDGSSILRAIPPGQELKIGGITFPKQKTLCEEANIDISVSNDRCAYLYRKAAIDYLNGNLPGADSWETWKSIVSQIGKIGGIK